jgi:muramoyltetrapeptide carboxypeptidase LdcA involved in peptidoglycan recycling
MANREIAAPEAYDGCVLLVETSEEMPTPAEVGYVLQSFGERGILGRFAAVAVARPLTAAAPTPEAQTAYATDLEASVMSAASRYASDALLVFNVDFGHTDPQLIMPIGGHIRLDGIRRRIWVTY